MVIAVPTRMTKDLTQACELLRKVGAGISAEQRTGGHDNGLRPDDRAHNDESDGGNAVDDAAENHLELIHGVNVGHAERGKIGRASCREGGVWEAMADGGKMNRG